VREEEETGSEDNYTDDDCSVLSSSLGSLNASTEHLLLAVAYPDEFKSLPSSELAAVSDKMSRLDMACLRCANCLDKFWWAGDQDQSLWNHINTCWRREDDQDNDDREVVVVGADDDREVVVGAGDDKFVARSEYADIRALAEALLDSEWELKQKRCVPVCDRGRCGDNHKNLNDTIDSSEPERLHLSDMDSSAELVVAAQTMLVYIVQAKDSIWHNKMTAVIGLPLHATVDDLDSSLRRLWVECCGHSSTLAVGGDKFQFPDLERDLDNLSIGEKRKEETKLRELRNVFTEMGECGTYMYDPRRPTTVRVTFLDTINLTFTEEAEFPAHSDFYLRGPDMLRGASSRPPIAATVLLRNTRPEVVCVECQENYALLLDTSNIDYNNTRNDRQDQHRGLFLPVGFCSLDCVTAFNQEMSLLPEGEDTMHIERSCLVYTTNSPRTGACCYGNIDLDSSFNTDTDNTLDTETTMDTSCSCPDCGQADCSTCESWSATTEDTDGDQDHNYSVKGERSPGYHVKQLPGGGGSGTPILTRYVKRNSASESPFHSRV